MQPIFIACDHNGIELKKYLTEKITKLGYIIIPTWENTNKQDDYPDVASSLAENMQKNPDSFGIAICGSGQGICMAMNRFSWIRAAKVNNTFEAKKTREHNHTNCLCFGSDLTFEIVLEIIIEFLNTKIDLADRHQRRVKKLSRIIQPI